MSNLSRRFDSWADFSRRLGTALSRRAIGFVRPALLQPDELSDIYSSSDLAARVCDLLPDEALSAPWTYQGDSEILDAIAERMRVLSAVQACADAARFARVYGDTFLLMVAEERYSGDLSTPLLPGAEIVRLLRVERPYLSVATYEIDPSKPGYGEPLLYLVTSPGQATVGAQVTVHTSRFLKFVGAHTSDRERQKHLQGWHASVLQRVHTTLCEFDLTWAAAQRLLQNSVQARFKMTGLNETNMAEGGAEGISRRVAAIDAGRSVANAIILDKDNEDFDYVFAPLNGVSDFLDRMAARVAAAVGGIPVTKLFGISPAGLNATGEGDAKSWYRLVHNYRTQFLEEPIEQLTDLLLAEIGRADEEYSLVWPPLDPPTQLEQAQLRQAMAAADASYISSQVLLPEEVAESRFGGVDGFSIETQLNPAARAADAAAAADEPPADETVDPNEVL